MIKILRKIFKSDENTQNVTDTDIKKERAILVGVDVPKRNVLSPQASIEELSELADTAGAEVVSTIIQKRIRPDNAFFIGKGIAEDIALTAQALKADLVIIDEELSGTQIRNLEEILNVRVIDRTNLILDIFAQRAISREGKLQVELAQLNYRLPRLAGAGLQMSRLAGGIGTRGPGETKLESDRRHLQKRITFIKKEIAQVSKHRKTQSERRSKNIPLIVLVGYTNAGKSSIRYLLLKKFLSQKNNLALEDPGTDILFATLDPTIRSIILPSGKKILLADTVGFIQKLPHQLVSAFKATLSEVLNADLLLHVVDISNPLYKEQQEAVYNVLREIGACDKKRITIYNKIDLADSKHIPLALDGSPGLAFSAKTNHGVKELVELIEQHCPKKTIDVELFIPFSKAKLISLLHECCKITEKEYAPEGISAKAVIPIEYYQKFTDYIISKSK